MAGVTAEDANTGHGKGVVAVRDTCLSLWNGKAGVFEVLRQSRSTGIRMIFPEASFGAKTVGGG